MDFKTVVRKMTAISPRSDKKENDVFSLRFLLSFISFIAFIEHLESLVSVETMKASIFVKTFSIYSFLSL